jgi:hypothetical protein
VAPIMTVSRGTNAWMLHKDTEPLALVVYADGTVMTTEGLGSLSEPLPTATIGQIPACMVDWAVAEFDRVMSLDMGDAMVTDQGTTVVTLTKPGQPVKTLSVYALGIGDDYMPEPAQKANRLALLATFDSVEKAMKNSSPWTPDRLKLISTSAGKNIPGHVWPGPVTLATELRHKSTDGCMVVTGETAKRVVAEIGAEPVLAEWTDKGGSSAAGTFVLGILLPGQPGCQE